MVDTYDDDTDAISTSPIDDGSVRSDISVDTNGYRDTDESSSGNGDDADGVQTDRDSIGSAIDERDTEDEFNGGGDADVGEDDDDENGSEYQGIESD